MLHAMSTASQRSSTGGRRAGARTRARARSVMRVAAGHIRTQTAQRELPRYEPRPPYWTVDSTR